MKKKIILILSLCFTLSVVLFISHQSYMYKTNEEITIIEPQIIKGEPQVLTVRMIEDVDPLEKAAQQMQQEMSDIEMIEDNKEWFLAYKDIVNRYSKWFDPPETVFDVFSEEEIRLICQVVETECYDQDFDSKCNVASIVFNRLESGEFGDTITEIVTATNPKQFAYGREKLTEDSILAVQYAFEIEDTTNGALYFHSNSKTDTFNRASYLFTDLAGHHFYK